MSKSKKLVTSGVALVTAAALVLGGTFAWQSISQSTLNEGSDQVNPGGRLHNDLSYIDAKTTDVNVYVENFTEEGKGDDIFARVRLSEYMEIVMNYGSDAEVVETVAGAKYKLDEGNTRGDKVTDEATKKNTYDYDYAVHYFGLSDEQKEEGTDNNKSYTYWTLNEGTKDSSAVYMPTFNKNKDSLMADRNGLYDGRVGGITNRGEAQYSDSSADYTVGDETTAWAIYDGDWNTDDELKNLTIDQLNQIIFGDTDGGTKADCWNEDFAEAVKLKEETHTAQAVDETKGLISMTEWLEKYEAAEKDEDGKLTAEGETAVYGYWVYDDSKDEEGNLIGNGWVYWSAPIKPQTTTGLLLDAFTLNEVMDDTWYYAINVEGQFVTANDLGRGNGTGFYTDDDDQPTENAEKLLEAIGVTLEEKDDTNVLKMQDGGAYTLTSTVAYISVKSGDTFRVKNTDNSTPGEQYLTVSLRGSSTELEKDKDYTYENGLLTITASEGAEWLNEKGTALQVGANDFDTGANGTAQIVFGDDGKLTLNTDSDSKHGSDITIAQLNKAVTIEGDSGTAPNSVEVSYEYEDDNGGYTYENGTLTITNADYVGKVLKVSIADDGVYGFGFVLVTAASATGGDDSTGGGQDTDTPDEDDDGNLYFNTWKADSDVDKIVQFSGSTIYYTSTYDYDAATVIKPVLNLYDEEAGGVTEGVTGWTIQINNLAANETDDGLGWGFEANDDNANELLFGTGGQSENRDTAPVIFNQTTGEITVQEKNIDWSKDIPSVLIAVTFSMPDGQHTSVAHTLTFRKALPTATATYEGQDYKWYNDGSQHLVNAAGKTVTFAYHGENFDHWKETGAISVVEKIEGNEITFNSYANGNMGGYLAACNADDETIFSFTIFFY